MKKSYKLKLTPAAASDLDEIYEYVAYSLSAPTAAWSLINKIINDIVPLQGFGGLVM